MSKKRVVVAMSGGVDSSMAAALLVQQGYEVIGVTMRLWTVENPDAPRHQRRCCSVEDVDDARAVCQQLDIPHYVLNYERPFGEHVVDYFVREYTHGRTPNPCLACNRYVKFQPLLAQALALGADYLATGHYARVLPGEGGTYELWRARDTSKDQSYVLYTLGQAELARTLFPVGEYTKPELRRLAADLGLPVAAKPDSADICFIPDGDYRRFVIEHLDSDPEPGQIVDTSGRALAQHAGIIGYTIGQRRGLGIATGVPLYVVDVDVDSNTVVVGTHDELMHNRLWADDVTFVSGQPPADTIEVLAKVRYRSEPALATLCLLDDGRAEVTFHQPQRAITPGQAVVFYKGDRVLGGGTIQRSIRV